jgi:hypothetical protein
LDTLTSVLETFVLPTIVGAMSGFAGGWMSGLYGLKSASKVQRLTEIERLVGEVRKIEHLCIDYWNTPGHEDDLAQTEKDIITKIAYLSRDCKILSYSPKKLRLLLGPIKEFRQASTGHQFQVRNRPADKKQARQVHIRATVLMRCLRDLEK